MDLNSFKVRGREFPSKPCPCRHCVTAVQAGKILGNEEEKNEEKPIRHLFKRFGVNVNVNVALIINRIPSYSLLKLIVCAKPYPAGPFIFFDHNLTLMAIVPLILHCEN